MKTIELFEIRPQDPNAGLKAWINKVTEEVNELIRAGIIQSA